MNDYKRVSGALATGAEPAMLCATCPWDRYCITPPQMTSAEVDAEVAKAKVRDEEDARKLEAEGKAPGLPLGSLMTIMTFSGKDTAAAICPVFAVRLRASDGRVIVDSVKSQMQGWQEA